MEHGLGAQIPCHRAATNDQITSSEEHKDGTCERSLPPPSLGAKIPCHRALLADNQTCDGERFHATEQQQWRSCQIKQNENCPQGAILEALQGPFSFFETEGFGWGPALNYGPNILARAQGWHLWGENACAHASVPSQPPNSMPSLPKLRRTLSSAPFAVQVTRLR